MATEQENAEPIGQQNTKANLTRLLNDLAEHPEWIEEVTKQVEEAFSEDRAIMIIDMSGYTRSTQSGRLIPFLLMVNQMRQLAEPVIEEHGGLLVRAEYDNLTCIFDEVEAALRSSFEISSRLEAANVILPSDRELYASTGIGYGTILNVENEIIYGNEVNLTSKLGEDVARSGEILLTDSAHERVKDQAREFKCQSINVSGVVIDYHVLIH